MKEAKAIDTLLGSLVFRKDAINLIKSILSTHGGSFRAAAQATGIPQVALKRWAKEPELCPPPMYPYWCRFYVDIDGMPFFEYLGPWWIMGAYSINKEVIVCAAVMAKTPCLARKSIEACFDAGHKMAAWDGAHQLSEDWKPEELGDRFQIADWMQWPYPGGEK